MERSSLYYDNGRQGFCYVLTNPHMPGIVKAGATRKHPLQRTQELGAGTGVPGDFTLAYFRDYLDAFAAETLIHEHFAHARINESREFFAVPVGEMIAFMDSLPRRVAEDAGLSSQGVTGGDYQRPVVLPDTPFAELFSRFDPDGPAELTAAEQAQCRALEASLAR